jgi:hypothetical protein
MFSVGRATIYAPLEFLLRWRSRVFPPHNLPFGCWLIVMDPCFISCDYSAQKFFSSLVQTASGAAMFTLSQQQGK